MRANVSNRAAQNDELLRGEARLKESDEAIWKLSRLEKQTDCRQRKGIEKILRGNRECSRPITFGTRLIHSGFRASRRFRATKEKLCHDLLRITCESFVYCESHVNRKKKGMNR